MDTTVTIVIFGFTGDLTKRKLLPALFQMVRNNRSLRFAIIGVAYDAAAKKEVFEQSLEFVEEYDASVWKTLQENTYCHQLDFNDYNGFVALEKEIAIIEKKHNSAGTRLFYLATAAHFFCTITQHATQSGMMQKKELKDPMWHRVVYEKPFGSDVQSARDINRCIDECLHEHQVFRVDHYLTKELVSNISIVRFTNCVFEPLWNNRYIDQVHIYLNEKIGIEGRGQYYDKYGALSDVVQNHMFQLLALIAMESPEKLSGDFIRQRRADLLKHVRVVDGILGQYDGYVHESGVAPDSTTETFASLLLYVENKRWSGVPFILKTGKHLPEKEVAIQVKFKQVDCLLMKNCPLVQSNWLTFSIAPEGFFSLQLNVKKPGYTDSVEQIDMDFCHSHAFKVRTSQAYEVLLDEVIRGEQASSVRFDEIEIAWRIIDTIKERSFPLYHYEKMENGPAELKHFFDKHGVKQK